MKITLLCMLALLWTPFAMSAQDVQSATVVGTVTDPTGAVVPNAAITLTNNATNVAAHATTNSDGAWYIPFQAAGTYTLTISVPGFKEYVRNGVALEIGQTPRFDVALEMGSMGQRVEVTGAAPILATDNAVIGGTESAKQIHDTPMVQAKPQHLMYYMEGSQANNDGTYHILGPSFESD